MDFFATYSTDNKLEQEGKWFDWGGGIELLIARGNNAKFTRMINKQYEAHKHTLDLKDTPDQIAAAEDRSHKIMAYVMARSVLLGWKGNVTYGGELLTYTTESAEKLLLLKEFQKEVARKADDYRNFRIKTEEEDLGNSSPTSAGTSNGEVASSTSST